MSRSLISIISAFIIGGIVGASFAPDGNSPLKGNSSLKPELLSCRSEIIELEGKLSQLRAVKDKPCLGDAKDVSSPQMEDAQLTKSPGDDLRKLSNSWRISSIEKFVPLSDDQKERLERKFAEEQEAKADNRESVAESLDDILGLENAETYREQMRQAFERASNEELERDTIWMARKLNLSREQEDRMRESFNEVEQIVNSEFNSVTGDQNSSPQQRLSRMIAENRARVRLRAERLRQVLSPEQYQGYVRLESESSSADVEVFHGGSSNGGAD